MSALARLPRKDIFLALLLFALFLFFSALAVFFIRSEMRLNRLVAEYQADKTATALLERAMNEAFLFDALRRDAIGGPFRAALDANGSSFDGEALGQELLSDLPSTVRGFGLYRDDGTSLATILAAPSAIEAAANPSGEDFQFKAGSQSITLVRRIGILPHTTMREMPMHAMGGMMGEPPFPPQPRGQGRRGGPLDRSALFRPAYLYLDMALPSFFRERALLDVALVAVPLVIAAILLTIGLLVGRNRVYRERIEGQRHLVHLGEIARTLSHEIKNPLSAIKLQTAILKRTIGAAASPGAGVTAAPAPPREIALIEEETERLRRLVERIGEYLRDPRGSPEPIDLYEFTNDLLSRFPWPVRRPDRPLETVAVRFDPDRLRSVLENLVKNGIESVEDAGPAAPEAQAPPLEPVSVSLQTSKGKVELIVADRGPGLSVEDAARGFDPFFTTKVRGTGVGLAISKRFVEAAGGTLRLRPARAGGAEAVVTLPRCSP